ncbi:putative ATP-dependent RNA helicase DDX10 [Holothuria leucospilota]|uniref:ATP-dependent RNA helicase DDX10 n=1 Tax=Holothuria leucospilota TaxID=206669 RepID=A0A9Q1BA32_HOLLE|nr:putative ATP-dependent RNA helicase DDX10 [Holothuria leucospilota]
MVIYRKLQSYCAQDPEIKESGKHSFVSYVKSVFLMKNKDVFDVSKLPLEEFAIEKGTLREGTNDACTIIQDVIVTESVFAESLQFHISKSAGEDDEVEALKETTAKKGKTLTKVAALKKLAKKQKYQSSL